MNKTMRSWQLPFLATAAIGLAACGGGSGGGGGGGGSSLTQEQQVAVASSSAVGAVTAAATSAESTLEDSVDPGTLALGAGAPIRNGEDPTDCTADPINGSGDLIVYDNSDGNNDTSLNISTEALDFPEPPFSNGNSLPTGTDSYFQVRSNCSGSGLVLNGSLDAATREDIGGPASGRSATVFRAGGFTGSDNVDAPDMMQQLVLTADVPGFSSIEFRAQGQFHSCLGCVNGDLGDFGGDPDLDQAFAAWLEMVIDFSSTPRLTYGLGNSGTDRLRLVAQAQGTPGVAEVDIDGRLAVEKEGTDCDFDVTYATVDPLFVENYAAGTGPITGGELDVTNNFTGDNFTVTYESDGTVLVDGVPVDIDEFDGLCEPEEEAAT